MLVVADVLQDHTKSSERAEMARFARQHFADIGKRTAVLMLDVIKGRTPIPALDIIGLDRDDRVQKLDRQIVITVVGRVFHAAHQKIASIAARRYPDRPDALLD